MYKSFIYPSITCFNSVWVIVFFSLYIKFGRFSIWNNSKSFYSFLIIIVTKISKLFNLFSYK
uniref:Uncharacterized protein n=1 Tax=Podoviridae sp. ct8Lf7 TaxID=2827723 RepID=A0A8S5RZY5_9CAUD|nr:MAG TPA: hypothetical protein [Podoviridae sp. ct8Lf7]